MHDRFSLPQITHKKLKSYKIYKINSSRVSGDTQIRKLVHAPQVSLELSAIRILCDLTARYARSGFIGMQYHVDFHLYRNSISIRVLCMQAY